MASDDERPAAAFQGLPSCSRSVVGTVFLAKCFGEARRLVGESSRLMGMFDIFLLSRCQIDRPAAQARSKPHEKESHRRLLWHGTDVGVAAAIVAGGLRIMPGSGGYEFARTAWLLTLNSDWVVE